MQRITLTGLCVWLVLGAAMALAQEESEAAPPPPEQTDRVASDDGMDHFVFPHGDSDADVATGIAAASGLAMVGFMMLWFMLYFGFIMFIMVSSMAVLLATVLAIYDCARRDFPDPNTRALWCILIVMTRWMGALIYYISVYRNNDPPLQEALRQRPATTPSA
jgi:hypothetical protein